MIYTWLRAFHTVARQGGFSAASKVLNVGQPTLSEQVKTLEERFDVELFYRRGRTIELTKAGRTLLSITQGMFGHETEAMRFLKCAQLLEVGELNVGSVSPYGVMKAVKAFRKLYPNIVLTVSVEDPATLLQYLMDFRVDIAFFGTPLNDPAFFSMPYLSYPVIVMVNADHQWRDRLSIRIEELADEKMILRKTDSMTRRVLEAAVKEVGVKIEAVMEINSREAIRDAVILGLGISVVSTLDFLPNERLRGIPVKNAKMNIQLHAACLANRTDRPLISNFIDVLRDELKTPALMPVTKALIS